MGAPLAGSLRRRRHSRRVPAPAPPQPPRPLGSSYPHGLPLACSLLGSAHPSAGGSAHALSSPVPRPSFPPTPAPGRLGLRPPAASVHRALGLGLARTARDRRLWLSEDSMRRLSRPFASSSSSYSNGHHVPRKPLGEIHLKVSTVRESRSDDKRFSIFSRTKRLHLRAETREESRPSA